MEPLPDMAQYSAINGMITDDFDGDGNLDICMNRNDYGTLADDVSAIIVYKDGRHQKRETGYGNSFLSQSARFITVDSSMSSIEITNSKGKTRKVRP